MTITQIIFQILIIIGFLLLFYWYAYIYERRKNKNNTNNNNMTTAIKIKYDVPFEVTEKQFNALRVECSGYLCHRIDEQGKFWIKVWLMKEVDYVKQILKENK